MNRVITMGELIVDMISLEKEISLEKAASFKKTAGGAPANVACAVGRLGGNAQIISRVGNDAFGDFLMNELKECNVNTDKIFRTDNGHTPVAFISVDENGNRDFSLYREMGTSSLLAPNMINEKMFDNCAVLHFGATELSNETSRQAHKRAIALARKKGAIISFDPNLRPSLWQNQTELRRVVAAFLPLTDIIKISSDELTQLSGTLSLEKSFNLLLEFGCRCIVYTKGSDGADFIMPGRKHISVKSESVNVADTTGAGDAFIGAVLYNLTKQNITRSTLSKISDDMISDILRFASLYAAHTVTGYGAIASMATMGQLKNFSGER